MPPPGVCNASLRASDLEQSTHAMTTSRKKSVDHGHDAGGKPIVQAQSTSVVTRVINRPTGFRSKYSSAAAAAGRISAVAHVVAIVC